MHQPDDSHRPAAQGEGQENRLNQEECGQVYCSCLDSIFFYWHGNGASKPSPTQKRGDNIHANKTHNKGNNNFTESPFEQNGRIKQKEERDEVGDPTQT